MELEHRHARGHGLFSLLAQLCIALDLGERHAGDFQLEHEFQPKHIAGLIAPMSVCRTSDGLEYTRRFVKTQRVGGKPAQARKLADGDKLIGHGSDANTLSEL